MSNDQNRLPVISPPEEEGNEPSCSPKIYVSNEEASLLAEMRELREQSLELRRLLASAAGDERSALESELERLRARREEVARQRERAFTRKMIMLGHLPPDYPV
jgi:chromosome segregation ATPase